MRLIIFCDNRFLSYQNHLGKYDSDFPEPLSIVKGCKWNRKG